jgi:hypothetical protein
MKKIEYAALYPFTLDGDEMVTYGPVKQKEAESMVKFVNSRARMGGFPERAVLVERTVEYSEWVPANTGIVPPWIADVDEESRRGGVTG